MSEKGLDLIPMLFEMMIWSAKYDDLSEARRISRLLTRVRAEGYEIYESIKDRIRNGNSLLPDELD